MASLLDTVSLAGTLVLALPAGLAGLELLVVRGEPLVGAVLLALAGALVVVERYVPSPTKRELVARLGGAVLPWGGETSEDSKDP